MGHIDISDKLQGTFISIFVKKTYEIRLKEHVDKNGKIQRAQYTHFKV